MEKIRLKNGTEFDLIPMGISERNSLRCFKFISDLPCEEILTEFEAESSLGTIEHILADGTVGATYADCVEYKSLTFIPSVQIDDNTVSDIYVVTISTDATGKELQALGQGITYAELALAEVYELLLGVMG